MQPFFLVLLLWSVLLLVYVLVVLSMLSLMTVCSYVYVTYVVDYTCYSTDAVVVSVGNMSCVGVVTICGVSAGVDGVIIDGVMIVVVDVMIDIGTSCVDVDLVGVVVSDTVRGVRADVVCCVGIVAADTIIFILLA